MSLCMSNWLIDILFGRNWKVEACGHESEFRRCVGAQEVKLHILTHVGNGVSAHFLQRRFSDTLHLRSSPSSPWRTVCKPESAAQKERERESLNNLQSRLWSSQPDWPRTVLWKLDSPLAWTPSSFTPTLISDTEWTQQWKACTLP